MMDTFLLTVDVILKILGAFGALFTFWVFYKTQNIQKYLEKKELESELKECEDEFPSRIEVQLKLITVDNIFDEKSITKITSICSSMKNYWPVLNKRQRKAITEIEKMLVHGDKYRSKIVLKLSLLSGSFKNVSQLKKEGSRNE